MRKGQQTYREKRETTYGDIKGLRVTNSPVRLVRLNSAITPKF